MAYNTLILIITYFVMDKLLPKTIEQLMDVYSSYEIDPFGGLSIMKRFAQLDKEEIVQMVDSQSVITFLSDTEFRDARGRLLSVFTHVSSNDALAINDPAGAFRWFIETGLVETISKPGSEGPKSFLHFCKEEFASMLLGFVLSNSSNAWLRDELLEDGYFSPYIKNEILLFDSILNAVEAVFKNKRQIEGVNFAWHALSALGNLYLYKAMVAEKYLTAISSGFAQETNVNSQLAASNIKARAGLAKRMSKSFFDFINLYIYEIQPSLNDQKTEPKPVQV